MEIEKVCRECAKFDVYSREPVTYRTIGHGWASESIHRTIVKGYRQCSASGKNPVVSMGLKDIACEVPDEFKPFKIKKIPRLHSD